MTAVVDCLALRDRLPVKEPPLTLGQHSEQDRSHVRHKGVGLLNQVSRSFFIHRYEPAANRAREGEPFRMTSWADPRRRSNVYGHRLVDAIAFGETRSLIQTTRQ